MKKNTIWVFVLALLLAFASASLFAQATAPVTSASADTLKQLGSIRKISGSNLTLATDQGTELALKVLPGARLLRLAPSQTDLKSAAPIQLVDLQVGDRVLVRGKLAADGVAIDATAIIVMKQQDIAQMKQKELLDWQRRGVGGLVIHVDSTTRSIALSIAGAGENKSLTVATTPKTTFKRYSPNSVKWEDATAATLNEIHPGDQLRAKGNKDVDGTQLVAEEIVAGSFRNIAGLINSIDSEQSTLTVQDLATKKPVTVKITTDSQMKKIPAQVAQGLAMRMKGVAPHAAFPTDESAAAPSNGDRPRGGDLNQLLTRLPAATLGDLRKGEAVMIVSTQGSQAKPPVAITLLDGVEALLTASPTGKGSESFLTPWSLASAPAGEQ
jgi:hypothetical protein